MRIRLLLLSIFFTNILYGITFTQNTPAEDTTEVNIAYGLLAAIKKADRFITKLDSSYVIDLPVGIVANNTAEAEKYAIVISELKVREGKTFLTAYMAFTIPGTTKKIAFKGSDIPFSFNGGFNGPVKLELVSDFDVALSNNITLKIKGNGKTKVITDCTGFKEMQLSADILFNNNLFIPENPDGTLKEGTPLKTSFETVLTDWNDLLIGISLEPFQLKGLTGVGFSIQNAFIDLSDFKNPQGITFGTQYQTDYFIDGNQNIWQGIYIKDAIVRMPMQFRKKNAEELAADSVILADDSTGTIILCDSIATGRMAISAQNLLIDELGFTGKITADRIMTLDEGDLGGWAFSVSNFIIDIRSSQLVAGSFGGQIKVPQFKQNSVFNYNAVIGLNNTYSFSAAITDSVEMDLWAADLMLTPNSTLNIAVQNDKFVPSLLLNGELSLHAPVNKNDSTSKKLSVVSIPFQGMKIQTTQPYFSVQHISLGTNQNKFSKFPVSISQIGFKNQNERYGISIGLKVNFTGENSGGYGGQGNFTVWGKKENDKWKYDGVEISKIAVNMSKPGAFEISGEVNFFRNDSSQNNSIYGNGFKGTLSAKFGSFGNNGAVGLDATVLFGNVDGYRYWFADALAVIPTGIPAGPVSIYGFGGGAYYHMKQAGVGVQTSEIGKSISGITYIPDVNSGLGFKASVKFGTTSSENAFNGDVAFGISFTTSGGINQISLIGNGYFATNNFSVNTSGIMGKAKNILGSTNGKVNIPVDGEKSQLWGKVTMLYDFPNNCFHSTMDIYANIAGGIIKGIGPGGKAGWGVIHFEPGEWYIYLGTPDNPNGINVLNIAKMTNYFMAGTSVPELSPPPQEVLQALSQNGKSYEGNTNTLALQNGSGFTMGANFSFDTGDRTFLIFYGRFGCGIGFDILLKNYGNLACEGSSEPIGINGWYAQGQAYAWIAAAVGIKVDLPFYSGKYKIFEMNVAALLQTKAPNPFWMKGNVGGNYNILNGLVKGHCSFDFEIGEQCTFASSNPLGGMPVIADLTPENDESDVSVFTTPQAVFNMPIGEVFEFQNENNETKKFKIKLEYFTIKTPDNQSITGNFTWNDRNDVLMFKSKNILPGETDITAKVKVSFQELIDGSWYGVTKNGSLVYEEKEIQFITGKEPTTVPQENVAYSYPAYRAFNYYQSEADINYINLDMGQPKLFNVSDEWIQKARITPISGGEAQLIDYTYDDANSQINFNLPNNFSNNKLYRFELVNLPAESAIAIDKNISEKTEIVSVESGEQTADVEISTKKAEGNRSELQEKVIYSMEFRTSNYNTFEAKLNGLNYSDGVSWELYPLVHSLTVNISGERFDRYEVLNLQEGTLINCHILTQETPWFTTHIAPLIILSNADLNRIGADSFTLPFLSSYMFQSSGTRNLSDAEIESGNVSDINVISGMKNYLAKYSQEYMYMLKNLIVNKYVNGQIPAGQLHDLFFSNFTPIQYGVYPVNISFTLPGQTNPNSTVKHIINFFD
ncbi:MAG: hypothetical protein GXO80_14290 [Chlorobi bacterium]|nr:hypothetical protein [Chlorobiota bacterium]